MNTQRVNKKRPLTLKEIAVFALLGAVMFCSKVVMEFLPNIHLLGMFTVAFTIVFRAKALLPIYVYVFLNGLFAGFSLWWIPYLYIWAILWGVVMLLPKKMPTAVQCIVYPAVCCLHGLCFGSLYAPLLAIMFGYNLEQTITWIIAGFGFDILHALGNLAAGVLIVPMYKTLLRVKRELI